MENVYGNDSFGFKQAAILVFTKRVLFQELLDQLRCMFLIHSVWNQEASNNLKISSSYFWNIIL